MQTNVTLIFLISLFYSCSNRREISVNEAENDPLVQSDGELKDSISLKGRSLMVFEFDTKNVLSLDKEFNISNDDGLLFNVSGQLDYSFGTRGYLFVRGADTMYLLLAGGFENSLIRVEKFKKGYFQRDFAVPTDSVEQVLGKAFISNQNIRDIPIVYTDYRRQIGTASLGETSFDLIKLNDKQLTPINRFLLENSKENIKKVNE